MRKNIHRMIAGLALVVAPLAACAGTQQNVVAGDSIERVREVLGAPEGYIRSGAFALLYYDRGKVELEDGRVTAVELVSAARAAERQAERARRAQAHREALGEEGRAVREDRRNDPAFLTQPAAEQLAYWEGFRRRYPMVPLEGVDLTGLARRAQEAREAELERELLAANWRRMEAEERAHEAELAARRAENRRRYRSYAYLYPPRIVTFRRSHPPPARGPEHCARRHSKTDAPYAALPPARITPVDPHQPLSGLRLSADANSFHYVPRLGARWTFPNPLAGR